MPYHKKKKKTSNSKKTNHDGENSIHFHRRFYLHVFLQSSYSSNKSGRSLFVRSNDCCNSHSLILASCPDNRISGTFQPL